MEAIMEHNHTNNDDNDVGGLMEKAPHLITAIVAVGGLVAAYFMTIGEFRVKDMELQQRVTYIEQKVNHIEETMDTIKSKLDARIPVVDDDRQSLRKEIEGLKEVITQMKPLLRK